MISFQSLILLVLFTLIAGSEPTNIQLENGLALPISPSSTSATNTISPISRAAVSTYWVASELVHQHVVPVIRDQLWRPTWQFLREQEEAAIQRRLMTRQQRQQQQQQEMIPSIQPRDGHEVTQPINVAVPIHPPTFVGRTRQLETPVTKQTRNLSSKNSWPLVLLLPMRFAKLSLAAWILAELLDRLGILHEETPAILRSQVHRVFYDLQPHWFHLRDWMVTTWHRIAPNNGHPNSLPTKYQFAMGATMGMMTAPLLSLAWKPAVVLYAVAEINARAKRQGRWNLEHVFHPTLAHPIDEGLEKLRRSIANLVTPITSSQLLLSTTGGGGVSKATTYSLGLSPCTAKPQVDSMVQEDWQQYRFWEMIRHGVVAGSLLGFMGKL